MNCNIMELNKALFAQIEKLGNDSLTGADLDIQIKKADTIGKLSMAIAKNMDLVVRAAKTDESCVIPSAPAKMLGLEER